MQSNNSDIRTIYNNSNINIQYDLMHETNNEIIHILAYFISTYFHIQCTHLNGQRCSAGSKPVVTLLPGGHSVEGPSGWGQDNF